MRLRRAAAWSAVAVAVVAAWLGVREAFREKRAAMLRAERDALELQAEQAERAGHPWAGVYISMNDLYVDRILLLAPDGRFLGSSFERYEPNRTGYAFGTAAFSEPQLTLHPPLLPHGDYGDRFIESYRLVRWGGVRCLIEPGQEQKFLDCMAKPCASFRPMCTRGFLYGDPDLPDELARARKKNPGYRSIEGTEDRPEFFGFNQIIVRKSAAARK